MKNKKIIPWILFTTFISTASCVVGVTDNTSSTKIYRYVNESGVEVALVGETNDNFDVADSLVLQNR